MEFQYPIDWVKFFEISYDGMQIGAVVVTVGILSGFVLNKLLKIMMGKGGS